MLARGTDKRRDTVLPVRRRICRVPPGGRSSFAAAFARQATENRRVSIWVAVWVADSVFHTVSGNKKAPLCGAFVKRMKGLEPSTFCMASRRSSQLSYIRVRPEYSDGQERSGPAVGGRWESRCNAAANPDAQRPVTWPDEGEGVSSTGGASWPPPSHGQARTAAPTST